MNTDGDPFAPLKASSTAMLTTYRRSGDPVPTPVSVTLADGRAYFATADDTGKAKRLAHNSAVTLAPCTASGKILGPSVAGRARRLASGERKGLLRPTRSVFWSYLFYRLRRKTMHLYEVTPGG